MKNNEQVSAVEMVRAIRDRHYEMLKDKSPEERRRFYAEQEQRLHERLGVSPRSATVAAAERHE
jgi:hypothetical protein